MSDQDRFHSYLKTKNLNKKIFDTPAKKNLDVAKIFTTNLTPENSQRPNFRLAERMLNAGKS